MAQSEAASVFRILEGRNVETHDASGNFLNMIGATAPPSLKEFEDLVRVSRKQQMPQRYGNAVDHLAGRVGDEEHLGGKTHFAISYADHFEGHAPTEGCDIDITEPRRKTGYISPVKSRKHEVGQFLDHFSTETEGVAIDVELKTGLKKVEQSGAAREDHFDGFSSVKSAAAGRTSIKGRCGVDPNESHFIGFAVVEEDTCKDNRSSTRPVATRNADHFEAGSSVVAWSDEKLRPESPTRSRNQDHFNQSEGTVEESVPRQGRKLIRNNTNVSHLSVVGVSNVDTDVPGTGRRAQFNRNRDHFGGSMDVPMADVATGNYTSSFSFEKVDHFDNLGEVSDKEPPRRAFYRDYLGDVDALRAEASQRFKKKIGPNRANSNVDHFEGAEVGVDHEGPRCTSQRTDRNQDSFSGSSMNPSTYNDYRRHVKTVASKSSDHFNGFAVTSDDDNYRPSRRALVEQPPRKEERAVEKKHVAMNVSTHKDHFESVALAYEALPKNGVKTFHGDLEKDRKSHFTNIGTTDEPAARTRTKMTAHHPSDDHFVNNIAVEDEQPQQRAVSRSRNMDHFCGVEGSADAPEHRRCVKRVSPPKHPEPVERMARKIHPERQANMDHFDGTFIAGQDPPPNARAHSTVYDKQVLSDSMSGVAVVKDEGVCDHSQQKRHFSIHHKSHFEASSMTAVPTPDSGKKPVSEKAVPPHSTRFNIITGEGDALDAPECTGFSSANKETVATRPSFDHSIPNGASRGIRVFADHNKESEYMADSATVVGGRGGFAASKSGSTNNLSSDAGYDLISHRQTKPRSPVKGLVPDVRGKGGGPSVAASRARMQGGSGSIISWA